MEHVGVITQEGKDLALPNPLSGLCRFKGMKRIESIPGLKEEEYLIARESV